MNSTFKSKYNSILNENSDNSKNKVVYLAKSQISLLNKQHAKHNQLFRCNSNSGGNYLNVDFRPTTLNFSLETYKKHQRNKSNTNVINHNTMSSVNVLSLRSFAKKSTNFKQQIEMLKNNFQTRNKTNLKKEMLTKQLSVNNIRINNDNFSKLIAKSPINKFRNDSRKKKNFFDHMKTECGLELKKNLHSIVNDIKSNGRNIKKDHHRKFSNHFKYQPTYNPKRFEMNNLNFDF